MDGLNTKENDIELELMVEDELARLQRQYRIMEGDRTAFLDMVDKKLGQQNRIINNLKKERHSILEDLNVAESPYYKRLDDQVIIELKRKIDEHNVLKESIQIKKKYVEEVQYQIKKIHKQILTLRAANQTSESNNMERLRQGQNNISKLENKLETSNNRFCHVLTQNKQMREEIDHLLKERQLFNKNWNFVFENLAHSKKFMIDLIEQATYSYSQREEFCQKLAALRHRALSDLQYHSEEMRELKRNLEHDVDLQNFLLVKGQRRIAQGMLKKELLRREQMKMEVRDQCEQYSKILHDIQEFTGEDNVGHLASQFVKQEEENFALFNYVHELNSELESLGDSISVLQQKLVEQRRLSVARSNKQKSNIEGLKNVLETEGQQFQRLHNDFTSKNDKIATVFKGVAQLFIKIKCRHAPLLDLLGKTKGKTNEQTDAQHIAVNLLPLTTPQVPIGDESDNTVINIYNVNLYLGILETRINEIMKTALFVQSHSKSNQDKKLLAYPAASKKHTPVDKIPTPCPICFQELVSTKDSSKLIRVFSRKEVVDKVYLCKRDFNQHLLLIEHNADKCHKTGLSTV